MGIDAEMLVRKVPHLIVNDEWLKITSWRLVEAIGESKFFVSRESQYGEPPRLAIERTNTRYREAGDPPPGSQYQEDTSGGPIKAHPGECLLEVHLGGRYYSPSYERGDILTYCAIAEWLEANIQGCEVWYGGDSSGVLMELFDEAKRKAFKAHLYRPEGREYFNYDSPLMGNDGVQAPKPCALCPGGKYRGSRCGWGGSGATAFASYHCRGCGYSEETRDAGQTYTEKKRD